MMELLQRGAKEGWFTYNGRLNKAEANMGNGECGVFLSSSAYIGNLTRASEGKFTWATGPLPRMGGYPQGNSIIGGASCGCSRAPSPRSTRASRSSSSTSRPPRTRRGGGRHRLPADLEQRGEGDGGIGPLRQASRP